jgi:immune inhibitor A
MPRNISILLIIFFTSEILAIIPGKYGVKIPKHVIEFHKMIQKEYQEGYWAKRIREREQIRNKIQKGILPQSALTRDTVNALTLLGRYSDSSPRYSRDQFQRQLFDGPNPTGTITQYYAEISYDQMYFTGFCTNWYQVPGTMSSYVGANNGLSSSGGPRFVLDLIKAADSTFDFSKFITYYDNSGLPRISFVAVVHTGAGAEAGASNIWSHKWNFRMLTGGQPYETNDVDSKSGKKVLIDGDYAIQPELSGNNNQMGELIEIGVFAHEFGHIFGLPDLYDTDNSSEGLGNWCLMAGGSWGGNGGTPHTPVHMSAWPKQRMGWVTPVDIVSFQKNKVVKNAKEQAELFRVWRTGSITNEYFLVENRQKIGFDRFLYTGGILIFHIDDAIPNNRNENHYKVGLVQADGRWDLNRNRNRGDDGDPFPGSTKNTRFDLSTNPNSNDHSKNVTYVSLRNIRHSSKDMIVDFDIGSMPFVMIKTFSLSENTAHKNERLEQGEIGNVNFTLKNVEGVNSTNTNFKIWADDQNIEFLFSEVNTTLNANSERNFSMINAIQIKPEFVSRAVYIKAEVDGGGSKFTDSFKVIIGIPKIMLIAKGDKPSLTDYYHASLTNALKTYESIENIPASYYYGRDIILYFTGKNKDSLFTIAELDSFSVFLNRGGSLFLSGQNLAEFLNLNAQSFLNNTLGINFIKNASLFSNKVYGISSDMFGKDISTLRINGAEGAANETSMDIIESIGNFNKSLAFKSDGKDAAGGWKVFPNNGKLFFLGFGFESINNDESTIKRDRIMQNILSWFDPTTGVERFDDIVLPNFRLEQNYPNPFNPSTVISYQLSAVSHVTLKVFDILGKEITTLVDEVLEPGIHHSTFHIPHSAFTSGVYFYQLRVGSFVETKKMILMK